MIVQDPTFGQTVNFDALRRDLHVVYDEVFPRFNLLGVVHRLSELGGDHPSISIAGGASILAYSLIVAAGEDELAASLKDKIFTLGWTEEHCGSDLLSITTEAAPIPGDPSGRMFHVRGRKWLINNSYHGDYHVVVGKLDPSQSGPRSLSLFLVPRSSTRGWQRLETHVLTNMVLTEFEIDGPGRLLGKPGQGLAIIQQMANASRYQCTFMGVRMVAHAIPATIEHLAAKRIFGEHPVRFSNVYRQLHDLVLQAAFYDFVMYRSVALNRSDFLVFYGTMLKSWLLLRINELLAQNLLVAGSKGFLRESIIGRVAIDSFVLPVFDGHYTINTLMTAKQARRYLDADQPADVDERLGRLRRNLFRETHHDELATDTRDMRRPSFFDFADYIARLELPIDVPARALIDAARAALDDIDARDLGSDLEHRYKTGDLVHWLESVLAAAEMWKVTGEDAYLNVVVQQFNRTAATLNEIVAQTGLDAPFVPPMRHVPIAQPEDARAYLLDLLDVRRRCGAEPYPASGTVVSASLGIRATAVTEPVLSADR